MNGPGQLFPLKVILPDGWVEQKSPEGRRFWHNTKTGDSTWEKPDVLKTEDEKFIATHTPWKEFSSTDGRLYWYNRLSKTSVWQLPDEVRQMKSRREQLDRELAQAEMQKESEGWGQFGEKKEALAKIRILFELKALGSKSKWEDASKVLQADSRFALFSILTSGEKKQAFSEYLTALQKKIKMEERKRKAQAKDEMTDAIHEWDKLHPAATYKEFAKEFCSHLWWSHLTERERDDLFQDVLDEIARKFFDSVSNRSSDVDTSHVSEMLDAYRNNTALLPTQAGWKETKEFASTLLRDYELVDALRAWEVFVAEFSKFENDRRSAAVRRRERKGRDSFDQLVEECLEKGLVDVDMHWTEFLNGPALRGRVFEDERYASLLGMSGSVPRELFDEKLRNIEREYEEVKTVVKQSFKSKREKVTAIPDFEEFLKYVCTSCPEALEKFRRPILGIVHTHILKRAQRKSKVAGGRKRSKKSDDSSDAGGGGPSSSGHKRQRKSRLI